MSCLYDYEGQTEREYSETTGGYHDNRDGGHLTCTCQMAGAAQLLINLPIAPKIIRHCRK